MTKFIILFIVCSLLLLLSAFFSGSETALFSLSEAEIEGMKTVGKRRKHFFDNLLHTPHNLLTTILLSNTVVNVAFSFLITLVFLELVPHLRLNVKLGMLLDIVIITTFLLIFGEFTPKFYALRMKKEFSEKSVTLLCYLVFLLSPFVYLFNLFNRWIISITKSKVRKEISYSELKTLFEVSEKEGVFKWEEREIINSLFTLTESIVSEIMVPRTKVFSFSGEMKIAEAYSLLLKKPYSRVPVYSTSEEKIDGIFYLKDLLMYRKEKDRKIKTLLRDAFFVPEKMRLKDLFLEFRNKSVHFAIVVNEFGGVEGIITMNDILEEMVGSIKGEYDKATRPLYRYISKNEILVDGELKIDNFPENFYKQLPRGDYETIGGFILANMGRVPEEDEFFVYKDLVFTVVKLDGRKLAKILIRKRQKQEKKIGL